MTEACSNGGAGSAACASARLEVISAKGEYETGPYNSKVSQQYADAYRQIVNLLNITRVDAQKQPQVKGAMANYAMTQLGVDKSTAVVGKPVKDPLFEFAPAIDQFLKSHLFCDIFQRDTLDWQMRELATISALTTLSGVNSQLKSHYSMSRNTGLTLEKYGLLSTR